jgi:hypothetical protein
MGTYDRLIVDLSCPHCCASQTWRVQFKYGDVRQNDHAVGDMVPRFNKPGRKPSLSRPGRIRISGVAEHPCLACGMTGPYAAITIEHDRMTAVELLTYMPQEDEDSVVPE